jgi:hypothetical protein
MAGTRDKPEPKLTEAQLEKRAAARAATRSSRKTASGTP